MLNQYEVTLSKYAFDQLDEIRQYYEFDLFLPHVAHKLLSEIENAVLSLRTLPSRMPVVALEPWRSEGIRKMAVGQYILYYWIDEEKSRVVVTAAVSAQSDQFMQLANMMHNFSDE
ncbi:MAG: type II toxin-antitoxin system RelE/ParE family toxin [Pyramidobacter sp.]|nr:type II toxin-antitoxin system RelE/ParE family toxin [Pyramidobacter sp.]